jgi:hypothetical protein
MFECLIEMIYTPTDELVSDILTKPLTGYANFWVGTLKCTKMVMSMRKNVER